MLLKFQRKGLTLIFRAISLLGKFSRQRLGLVRLGSDYGGWWVPLDLIDSSSICYLVGAGEDISFDTSLCEKTQCVVRIVDPTPRAIAYVSKVASLNDRFTLTPLALWSSTTTLEFFKPRDDAHVSYSLTNEQRTTSSIQVATTTLEELQREFGDESVSLLKLDIEGAEHEVLRHMLDGEIRPTVICVEFDGLRPWWAPLSTFWKLRNSGYSIIKAEGLNITLVLRR